jgi:predicted ATPase with chaperone activity
VVRSAGIGGRRLGAGAAGCADRFPSAAGCRTQIDKYLARISGPLVDRIDIHIEVPAVPFTELRSERDGTDSGSASKSM